MSYFFPLCCSRSFWIMHNLLFLGVPVVMFWDVSLGRQLLLFNSFHWIMCKEGRHREQNDKYPSSPPFFCLPILIWLIFFTRSFFPFTHCWTCVCVSHARSLGLKIFELVLSPPFWWTFLEVRGAFVFGIASNNHVWPVVYSEPEIRPKRDLIQSTNGVFLAWIVFIVLFNLLSCYSFIMWHFVTADVVLQRIIFHRCDLSVETFFSHFGVNGGSDPASRRRPSAPPQSRWRP